MSKLIILLIFSLILSACVTTKPDEKNPTPTIQTLLDKHQKQWKNSGAKDYSYEFRRSCFCVREYTKPVLIRVKNNTVIEARFKDTNQPIPEKLNGNRQTIPMLFKTIQDAINRKAHSIKVKYDEKYGYPTSIAVDYDVRMADEELYLSAKNLQL